MTTLNLSVGTVSGGKITRPSVMEDSGDALPIGPNTTGDALPIGPNTTGVDMLLSIDSPDANNEITFDLEIQQDDGSWSTSGAPTIVAGDYQATLSPIGTTVTMSCSVRRDVPSRWVMSSVNPVDASLTDNL